MQALLRRSIPQIGEKLYEISDLFDNNIERIITHGQHLDHIRREAEELRKDKEEHFEVYESKTINSLRYNNNKAPDNFHKKTRRFDYKGHGRSSTSYFRRRND